MYWGLTNLQIILYHKYKNVVIPLFILSRRVHCLDI